ncbi:titin [Armigeres subalbatus]|uniref:titin n=1 Tax=Armigeres subalbatus TaxID=124917 RepID=UPI002ED39391
MKTKKQLAAAAAAAAAAAENKAASVESSHITVPTTITATSVVTKKVLKRLQPKTKEVSPKSNDQQQSNPSIGPASESPTRQPKSSAAKTKSPIRTKQDSVAPNSVVAKNVKNTSTSSVNAPSGSKVKKSQPATGAKKPNTERKKMQKELNNLGITDRAITQIDTAAVNRPCNPSISEMVKTKSRATVSQQKITDFGALGGPSVSQKIATAATNVSATEVPKPSEQVGVTTPTKKKPATKTKDTKQEDGAKNKTPVTVQSIMPSIQPSSQPLLQSGDAKEDVKTPPIGTKQSDGKNKAKKQPENKDDNNAAAASNVEQQPQKTGKKNSSVAPKPRAKSKKAILQEKRAAELKAAEEKAAEIAAAAAAKQEAEDKLRLEEDQTCSLELVESDDKNDEEEVQSRIEDIMKSLEDDDDEDVGMGPLMVKPNLEEKEPEKQPLKGIKSKTDSQKLKKTLLNKANEDKIELSGLSVKASIYQSTPKTITKRKSTKPRKPSAKKKPETKRESESQKIIPDSISPEKYSIPIINKQPNTADQCSSSSANESTQSTVETKNVEKSKSPEPTKTIRSSTENDDDVPLNKLKDQPGKPESFAIPQTPPSVEPSLSTPATPQSNEQSTEPPAKSKRKYVRKTPTNSKRKLTKAASVASAKDAKDKLPTEKKDVYDFDESESDTDGPVKPEKPVFKRKQVHASCAKEDELEDEPDKDKTTFEKDSIPDVVEMKKLECENESEKGETCAKNEELSKVKVVGKPKAQFMVSDSDSEQSEEDKPLRKPSKPTPKPKVTKPPPRESITDSEAEESEDDDKERDPDERPETPVSRKIKQEVRDSSDEDSDGYSSEESVRTRIVKKQLTAKTRHLKLYGFWSGPKRHRVASLNAIAKVHCLYENETRAALEASLMKQVPPRAPRAKEVKKEKVEKDESKGAVKEEDKKSEVQNAKKTPVEAEKDKQDEKKCKEEEKKQKEEEKKKVVKVVSVKEEKKKVAKKTELKEDKKKERKKVEVKEEKKEEKKKEKKKDETESDSESEESEEEVVTRTLRCVPGLRGVGKHWDPNASSMESEGDVLPDSDETYAQGKDTDPVKKRKVKRKVIRKVKPKTKAEKVEKADKPKPPAKKIKKEVKALLSDAEKMHDDESSSSSACSEKPPTKSKTDEPKKRKREPKEKKEVVEVLGKKRMASLNATAMLAATYEVQRILYRNTDSDSDSPAEKPKPKKVKEQKETKEVKEKDSVKAEEKKSSKAAVKETKNEGEVEHAENTSKTADKPKEKEKEKDKDKEKEHAPEKEAEVLLTIKSEPMRDKKDDTSEVKCELEEPRPVSSNVVIAQDTEVTITGVYVNSSLGSNQEAYCKMQYRVQQSVTEERLVRPGEAPPKSYTPLTALSSMRPPNDQALSTPPLFCPPAQCDSPLGLVGPPRGFYPPSTSSSGSSSAFCAPIPHDSPGYYQPAGPLISPHLLAQAPPSSSSQHSASSSTITKQPPESDSPVQSLPQPPSSSTADSTDSDVLLTAGDLSSRSQSFGRYGPSGPPSIYSRPVQMHCPPPHLAPNYYAAPPYSQYPPEMYYAHAYPPAHFYPKFAQYYPTSRRYYPGHPGPGEHLYEQPPPTTSGPVPPPSGAQLIPAGPQGPQHLEHYPGPPPYPYPGYGSPGPGPGGQCYPRNLQPPPYMDAHYTTNCPCPMQSCPKNVNAGSLIGIKASKGPVASTTTQNSHHIASAAGVHSAAPQTTVNNNHEPILISSGSSTSSSPAPLDLHSPPIIHPAEVATSISRSTPTSTTSTASISSMHSSVTYTTSTSTTTTPSSATPIEPHAPNPESDHHSYMYYPNHHHYHHHHRPSAPPPTHPLQRLSTPSNPLLTEVKAEPSTPTLESESKSIGNIPKLLPLTTTAATVTMIKQELPEVKQEPPSTFKKEDFEETGPAMTPDLLLDEALIKKEGIVSELLLPTDRCFKEAQHLDDKSLLSDILTTDANIITSKTTGSDSCTINSKNNSVSTNNSSISNAKVQLVDNVQPEIPASMVKRRPLLVACKKTTPKKSPPNSYKNLIKRTNLDDEATITVLSDDEVEEDEEERTAKKEPRRKLMMSKPRKLLKRTRRVFGAEQLRHLKKINKTLFKTKHIRRVIQRPSCIPKDPQVAETNPRSAEIISKDPKEDLSTSTETPQPRPHEERPRPMSNVELTIDLVAKGYFSEPEIVSAESAAKSRTLKKLKLQEGRSQSEQNRGKRERSTEGKRPSSKKPKKLDPLETDFDKRKSKSKSKKMNPTPEPTDAPINSKDCKKTSKSKSPPTIESNEEKHKKEPKQSSKKKSNTKVPKDGGMKRATSTPVPPAAEAPVEVQEPQPLLEDPLRSTTPLDVSAIGAESTIDDRETDFDDATTMLVDDDLMSVDTTTMINRHNNNNNSTVENKNTFGGVESGPVQEDTTVPSTSTAVATVEDRSTGQHVDQLPGDDDEDDEDDEEEIMLAKRFAKKSSSLKRTSRSRSKSKSRKFSIKKRHRVRMTAEVEEVIIPRKCTGAPRWSNGWTWEGHPFQGKVFLNSDDPPVLRTCYPAMRHSEGDIIRPRDCVLLRAGSKRAELPYVAKVAHLWENPEDGEMMMSLLWYYRPEHTEQGRQSVDGPDEVFASRHKDHNSVACIEDKCYVLTFSEYCRFRRQLKGFEEGIEEHPSIVPALRRENPRVPPSVVAPDLVMYCQRVYEFRLKRLLKQPS